MKALRTSRLERTPLRARRRIWASAMLVVVAIVGFGVLGVRPLVASRSEDQDVRSAVLMLQEIAELRTAVSAWQVYIEPHFADFSSGVAKIDPIDLANGALLAQTQSAQAKVVITRLREEGLNDSARNIEAADATYTKSIAPLAALAAGAPQTVIDAAVAAETGAFSRMLAVTASAATQLRAQTARSLEGAAHKLDNGRRAFLIADAIAVVLAIGGGILLGERARRRESAGRMSAERHEFETTLTDALEMAKFEPDAYRTMTDALGESVPRLQVEMLVADSSRAHFHQTLHTETDEKTTARSGCGVVSPVDCPATRRGRTLVFPTSRALNACPFLKERPTGHLAAACIPISITGQTSGVVHATAPDGLPPTGVEIGYLEVTSRRASERIAMLRAFEKSEQQARTDPLTGLWNRRSLENRINDLAREGTAYSLAYGDLDHFKVLNDTHGHEAGDQALRLFSRVLREAIRPGDITARYGGEEFVIVLPDCPVEAATKLLERLRERLALTLATGRVPPFTVSFGLASSVDADTFDEVVALADRALLTAKVNGRNRTILATDRIAPSPTDAVSELAEFARGVATKNGVVQSPASPDRTA